MENLNINYDKTVSNATVSMISAGAILVISVLIVLLVLVIKRWKGRFIPLALGVLSYVVFGFMFSQLLMSVLSLIPNVDQSFTYNTNAYVVIYNILLAAGFGIARWFTAKMMTDRYNRTGDVLMAGTGPQQQHTQAILLSFQKVLTLQKLHLKSAQILLPQKQLPL